ncbi:hypothetical protein JTB14_012849 [Gonioctena quinquepunctata]|nr:hypothetical protein JTB14_012849 [Gonioctena quinquepunctata]
MVTTNASDKGISGVLCQMKNGEERTVACVSRTLMPAEKGYSTVEKEAHAIYFAVYKLYHYFSKFKLRTDQKALVALFGENRFHARAPVETVTISEEAAGRATYVYSTESLSKWPINNGKVRVETEKDNVLSQVKRYEESGRWQRNKETDTILSEATRTSH